MIPGLVLLRVSGYAIPQGALQISGSYCAPTKDGPTEDDEHGWWLLQACYVKGGGMRL
jgi:hypothetical protein